MAVRPARKPKAPFVRTALLHLAAASGVTVAMIAGGATVSCGNPPMMDDCPSSVPSSGTRCDGRVTCSYPDTYCGSSAPTEARCTDGRWELTSQVSCNPPPPDYFDSGTFDDTGSIDVGGDVAADATTDARTRTDVCPTTEPVLGASCDVTANKICPFANLCPLPGATTSSTNSWRCSATGAWTFDQKLATPIACPTSAPKDGEACGCAMYLPKTCTWSSSCGPATGTCDGATQKWKMAFASCGDAGSPDTKSDARSDTATSDAPASDAPAAETRDAAEPASDAAADALTEDAPLAD